MIITKKKAEILSSLYPKAKFYEEANCLTIGTNSNITIIIQSLIWILILLITSNFNFKPKEIKFIYVILLSLFFTFQQFSEDRFYLQENKYFDISMSIENYYLINIFLSFYLVLCLI